MRDFTEEGGGSAWVCMCETNEITAPSKKSDGTVKARLRVPRTTAYSVIVQMKDENVDHGGGVTSALQKGLKNCILE